MATNKILPWAQTGTSNVLSDDAYAADVATGGLYGDGVKTGQASSQQANKTWRQATAPGSGLAQFLVDNLNVDVTDADTPATFSSRIANAILKLAQISPFNQSWASATGGYRKYAIVSDSSGNYWSSTADQNVTVPGDSGAKWQSLFNGLAQLAGGNDFTGSQTFENTVTFSGATGFNAKVSNAPAAPTTGVGGDVPNTYWVDQYYARKTALQSEANARIAADATKANLAGGNDFTGNQTFENTVTFTGAVGFNAKIANAPAAPTTGVGGDVPNTYWVDQYYARATALAAETQARASADTWLQNQINGKQPAGNYVTGTSAGQKIFIFTATVTGTQDIALPQVMSNVLFVTAQGGTDGKGTGMTNVISWTNTTVKVSVASYHTGAPQGATITQTFLVVAIP